MEYENILENLSVMSKSVHGVKHLRDFILTKALDGSFSETKPESWRKSSLGDEVEIIRGITFPSSAKSREHADGRIVCLRTTNVQEELNWNDLLYVPESYVKNKDQYVRKNDILISMANSRELVGKVSLVTRDDIRCTLGGFIAALRCSDAVLPEFLMILLRTPSTKERMIDSSTQTTNIANISLGRLRPLEICLPSLDEQLEIIAKVSELFAKCDQLELSLAKIHMLSDLARKSSIDAISTAQTTKEMEIAWGRIHQNWDLLVSSPEAIETMRILILDLAVRGDLVKVDTLKANKIVDWKTSEMKLDEQSLVGIVYHLPRSAYGAAGVHRHPPARITTRTEQFHGLLLVI
jgi:type I restriction enzyme S subunit